MNLSSVQLPKPIVPNVIPADRAITRDIVDHIDAQLQNGRGLFVVDFTGTLTRIICARLPRARAKDVLLFDPLLDERAISANFLNAYPGETPEEIAEDAVTLFQNLYGADFSYAEAELLTMMIRALYQAVWRGDVFYDGNLCPAFLVACFFDAEYRECLLREVWDSEIKAYWEDWGNEADRKTAARLAEKLAFLITDEKAVLSANSQERSGFDVGEVPRSGKITLINPLSGSIPEKLMRYYGMVFFNRFERAAPAGFPLENIYFFSGSRKMESDFVAEAQAIPDTHTQLETILRRYCAAKYGRQHKYVSSELFYLMGARLIGRLNMIYGNAFSLPLDSLHLHQWRRMPMSLRKPLPA